MSSSMALYGITCNYSFFAQFGKGDSRCRLFFAHSRLKLDYDTRTDIFLPNLLKLADRLAKMTDCFKNSTDMA